MKELGDRLKVIQGHLVPHYDFDARCRHWEVFIDRVEKTLAADLASGRKALQNQQKEVEVRNE